MTSLAPHVFNANELWTLVIAAYAAVVSTFVLGWDAYKWLASGPKINISASLGMSLVGGGQKDRNTYVSVTAWNIGDQPTTIINLGAMYYEDWWHAYFWRRKFKKGFIIADPSQSQRIPYRFEVGSQWVGLAIQDEEITSMAKNGYLFLVLYTANGYHGHRVRVKIKDEKRTNIDS